MKIKIRARKAIWMLSFASLLVSSICGAEHHSLELTPSITMTQTFDDNIYLTDAYKNSDLITTVSPGMRMSLSSAKSALDMAYSPTWVWYRNLDQYDTVRHSASAFFSRNIAEYLVFDIRDSYIKSEEPVETLEDMERFRSGRSTYQRNRGSANMRYRFGRENSIVLGYDNNLLLNDDPMLDDGAIQTPHCDLSYWINESNGMALDYRFTKAVFWRDKGLSAEDDDYEGNGAGLQYIHRFTPHTRGTIGYRYTDRVFEGLTENYTIHEETLGFAHSFSPTFSLSLQGGYFIQVQERSENTTGYTYNASLKKSFEQGNVSFGGRGGWEEEYLDVEAKGFIRYWTTYAAITYRLAKNLTSYQNWSYRQERDEYHIESRIVRAGWGLSLEFLRWYTLSLDYAYRSRDDDDDEFDYNDNRIMLTISAGKLWKW